MPDWGKRGTVATWTVGGVSAALALIAYIRPPDPAHPIRFDFIYNQISLSVPLWVLVLLTVVLTAIGILVFRAWPQPAVKTELSGLEPVPKQIFDLENKNNDLSNRLAEARREGDRIKQEADTLRGQLETPQLAVAVTSFDAYEEIAETQPGQTERLLYGTNNRILIRVHLKISNANRVETNIQGIGMATRALPDGNLAHSSPPAEFPATLRHPIKFGIPLEVSLDFWIDHADAQSIVKSFFVIALHDGAGQQVQSENRQISRVLPNPPKKAEKAGFKPEFWEWVGKIRQEAFEGEMLLRDLGRLEYKWDMDGTKLIHPLADHTMPAPGQPLSFLQRELLGFRFRYRDYLLRLKGIVSDDFKSLVVEYDFPANVNTHDLKEIMQLHIDGLRDYAEKWIKDQKQ